MPEALPLQPGDPRTLGGYAITGRIGVGEHGAVFAGRAGDGRPVAVKLLHVPLDGRPVAGARFAGAFAAARRVSGFCAAEILAAGTEGDRAYVVGEFVDGPSLAALVADEGPRGPAVLERLAVGTAVALAAVHRAGAVHHDFRPANVLLGPDGPRVTDVALRGALEAVGAVPEGTSGYQAPEQLGGAGAGAPADVFGWGATLLFAAAGAPPFGAGPPAETAQRVLYDDPDLAPLPEPLRGVVADALAKSPADRPTAARVLERLLDDGALAARLPAPLAAEARALAGLPSPMGGTPPAVPVPAPAAPALAAPAPAPAPPAPVTVPTPAVGEDAQATAMISVPPSEPDDDGTALIPGLSRAGGDRTDSGTAVLPAVPDEPESGGRVLGLALSVGVGVLVGIVIITLVLWPRFSDDGGSTGDPANVADGRPVSAIPGAFAGTWTGTVVNETNGGSFPVQVTFQEGDKTARAAYPKEGCAGTLSLTRGTGSTLQMRLDIGKPCTPGHIQVARQADGTLQYSWSRSEDGRPVGYQGRLTRTK
ncbi:serine/threonine protein kinase [Actinomadura atramentaria]|uniref:serine/threonine protein kinase n=1 Tax=Actinomadura atramentaria TaxID=1990 RepID=UPI0003645109|nr:protein kinase [Actinomadura atramentaria]